MNKRISGGKFLLATLNFTGVLIACLLGNGSCTKDNPLFCDTAKSCALSEFPYCDVDGVQEDTLQNTCIAKPEQDTCNDAMPCKDKALQQCKNPVGDGQDGYCVECKEDSNCPSNRPKCDKEENICLAPSCSLGPQGDAQCKTQAPSTPYCADFGRCAICTKNIHCGDGKQPVCDSVQAKCRACKSNQECNSNACDFSRGSCLEESNIVYLADNGSDGPSCGKQAYPCAKFNTGTGALKKVTSERKTIVILRGTIQEQIVLDGLSVHIIGNSGTSIAPILKSTEVAIEVSGGSNISMEGVFISQSNKDGTPSLLQCSEGSTIRFTNTTLSEVFSGVISQDCNLEFIQSTVQKMKGMGLKITGGSIRMQQSKILNNAGGGIIIEDSNFEIINSLIANNGTNGDSGSSFGGITLRENNKKQRFHFNTVVANRIGSAINSPAGMRCIDSGLDGRNNILALGQATNAKNGIVSSGCHLEYSLIEDKQQQGRGNIKQSPTFKSTSTYHLALSSAGVDEADPNAQEITDIDSTPRPQGSSSDMGMDEVEVQ